jgi:hypothetical protein
MLGTARVTCNVFVLKHTRALSVLESVRSFFVACFPMQGYFTAPDPPPPACSHLHLLNPGCACPCCACRMCWRIIAQELNTGRTSKQCREHYLNSLRLALFPVPPCKPVHLQASLDPTSLSSTKQPQIPHILS